MDAAIEAIHRWSTGLSPVEARQWVDHDLFRLLNPPLVVEETSFRFTFPGWSFFHSQAQWSDECFKSFVKARDEYIEYMEDMAKTSGFVEAPVERNSWHVAGFVQYQVLNRSKADIGNDLDPPVKESAVDKAVRKIAFEAGIAPRRANSRLNTPNRAG
jgi:hypothetical protein